MSLFTYKSLYQYVEEVVDKRNKFSTISPYENQLDRTAISPVVDAGRYDASTAELITAIQNMLSGVVAPRIIDGLTVTATVPISNSVIVSAGSGTVAGYLYTLTENIQLSIPFDPTTALFYILLYKDSILIEKSLAPDKLTIAKIVVPSPGDTLFVQDQKDTSWNAYIINLQPYNLFGNSSGKLEDDAIELLRDNISPILADNLIGNIRLTEDLKIINTAGTVELNSDSLKFFDTNAIELSEFNTTGVYFYDPAGNILAKFTRDGAMIGNISVLPESIQSSNFVEGSIGFRINSNGDVEFNNLEVRGTVYATAGEIGGWTIASDSIYATTTGTIKTSLTVGSGSNGVVLDKDGLRVYDDVLGCVVNLPSDGSAPTFSSGVITSVVWEIDTSSILRTSDTVGDGSASSAGILINNTGIYGCGSNQTLSNANLKALADGTIFLSGEIVSTQGQIGSVTITSEKLSGGIIEGALIRSGTIETSDTYPRIRIDNTGLYYLITSTVGKYGTFQYGSGVKYGAGVSAYLFNKDFPIFTVLSESSKADIRLYNRSSEPGVGTGPHVEGDLICVDGFIEICETAGSPGTFKRLLKEDSEAYGLIIEQRTSDPLSPYEGQMWLRTDL